MQDLAAAMHKGLLMSPTEKVKRHDALYKVVNTHTSHSWAALLIRQLLGTIHGPNQARKTPYIPRETLEGKYEKARKRLFFFDYDVSWVSFFLCFLIGLRSGFVSMLLSVFFPSLFVYILCSSILVCSIHLLFIYLSSFRSFFQSHLLLSFAILLPSSFPCFCYDKYVLTTTFHRAHSHPSSKFPPPPFLRSALSSLSRNSPPTPKTSCTSSRAVTASSSRRILVT